MTEWISAGKGKHGLQYREHETLTTGVGRNKRPLRYYKAVVKFNKKTVTDIFGWENEFKGGSTEIESLALQYKMNRKMQTPPFTHREFIENRKIELQEIEETKTKEQEALQQAELSKFNVVFGYYCDASEGKTSLRDEKSYYNTWIKPEIGDLRLDEIKLLNLERIKKKMNRAGRAPRTIGYIKSIIRQVFNYAIKHDLFKGIPPTRYFLENQVINNRRKRYLTPEEAELVLNKIRATSEKTYRITLLSMYTGMRFSEITRLQWQHINIDKGNIQILDPKNEEDRTAYMNDDIKGLFSSIERGKPEDYVFPAMGGKLMTKVSHTFPRAIADLGLNEGITDRRMKVVFHTMRHSCASWLANEGEDIRVIGRILGHKTLAMTMRYSHINDSSVQGAMQSLNGMVGNKKKDEEKVVSIGRK